MTPINGKLGLLKNFEEEFKNMSQQNHKKEMISNSSTQVSGHFTKRIIPSTSSLVLVGSLAYGIFFGFSFLVFALAFGSLFAGLGSYLLYYVKSGQYLPENQVQHLEQEVPLKRLFNRLRLKDKIDSSVIDSALGQLKKVSEKEKGISQVLSEKFNPGELSFERFQQINMRSHEFVQSNLKEVYNLLSRTEKIDSDDLRQELIDKMQKLLDDNDLTMNNMDKLLVSLSNIQNINETSENVEQLMAELENLVQRSKKF